LSHFTERTPRKPFERILWWLRAYRCHDCDRRFLARSTKGDASAA
jgi:hypothetical protein